MATGAVDLRGVAGQRGVAGCALELALGMHRRRPHGVTSRHDSEVGMVQLAHWRRSSVGMAGATLLRMAGRRVPEGVDGIADWRRYVEQGVDRDHPVFGFAVAVVAGPHIEIGLRGLQIWIGGDLGRMALLAGDEMSRAGRLDQDRTPVRAGGPAPVNVHAIEEVLRMAEQTLGRRRTRRTPVRSAEQRLMRRAQIDRVPTGGCGPRRGVASRARHVLSLRYVLMAGCTAERDLGGRSGDSERPCESVRVVASNGEQPAGVKAPAAPIGVAVQAVFAVRRQRWVREVDVAVSDAADVDRAEAGMDLID